MKREKRKSILIIYTGGTIGMVQNPVTGAYEPFNFRQIESKVPELKRFDCKISTIQFEDPLDSSDIVPDDWARMAKIVDDNYQKYNGLFSLCIEFYARKSSKARDIYRCAITHRHASFRRKGKPAYRH